MNPKNYEYYESWSSWEAFVDHAEHRTPAEPEHFEASKRNDPSWKGVESFDEALGLARAGWAEGTKQANPITDSIEHKITGQMQRADIHYDITGEILDVGRYCTGEPEHWGVWQETLVDGPGVKFLHLTINLFVSSGVEAELMIRRGATLTAYIRLLELGGYRVKVTGAYVMSGKGTKGLMCLEVPIKDYDTTLDSDRLVYAVAHPSVFRCLGFAVMEGIKNKKAREHFGVYNWYGTGTTVPEEDQGDVHIANMDYRQITDFGTPERCEQWVISQLKAAGVLAN